MKHLKLFENNIEPWEEIQGAYDVFQLMEILMFKWREQFLELNTEIFEYEGDYNPTEYYEQIRYVLEQNNLFDEYLENWEQYGIEKDENDPFHWRYRKKQQDNLMKGWDL